MALCGGGVLATRQNKQQPCIWCVYYKQNLVGLVQHFHLPMPILTHTHPTHLHASMTASTMALDACPWSSTRSSDRTTPNWPSLRADSSSAIVEGERGLTMSSCRLNQHGSTSREECCVCVVGVHVVDVLLLYVEVCYSTGGKRSRHVSVQPPCQWTPHANTMRMQHDIPGLVRMCFRSSTMEAMIIPVVVRPRPIWQLNTVADGSWPCATRASSSWAMRHTRCTSRSTSLSLGAFSSVTGTRTYSMS